MHRARKPRFLPLTGRIAAMGSDLLPAEYAASINFASDAGPPPFAPMGPLPLGPVAMPYTDLDLGFGQLGHAVPLSELSTPRTPAVDESIAPAKNILALISQPLADGAKAPVLEFRLKADDDSDSLTACHRIRAFLYNETVSATALTTNGAGMETGRAHLFDLDALNLSYHGSSAWSVAKVTPLPSRGVSMVLLDGVGNCSRLDSCNTTAPIRANAPPPTMGEFFADAAPGSNGLPPTAPSISLRWNVKPPVSASAQSTGAVQPERVKPSLAKPGGESWANHAPGFIPIAPMKPRKPGVAKPDNKLTLRMAATLRFFTEHDAASRRSASRFKLASSNFRKPSKTMEPTAHEAVLHPPLMAVQERPRLAQEPPYASPVSGENANGTAGFEDTPNDESFMDLVACLMEEEDQGQEDDAFDLVHALARDIATHGHHLTPGHPLNDGDTASANIVSSGTSAWQMGQAQQ